MLCRSVISPSEMPKRSKKNAKSRKRFGGGGRLAPLRSITPLANRMVQLTFCSNWAGTEGGVGAGVYNFYRLNGPYDPDTAVLSLSTPGLAALSQLYRSMRVMRVRVEVSGMWHSTANVPGTAGISLIPLAFQPVVPTNPTYWPVQPLAKHSPTVCHSVMGTYPCGTFPPLRASWNLYDVANITKEQYRDEADYASLTNSNPTRQIYLAVAMNTLCGVVCTVIVLVKLEYLIEFFDPYPLQ